MNYLQELSPQNDPLLSNYHPPEGSPRFETSNYTSQVEYARSLQVLGAGAIEFASAAGLSDEARQEFAGAVLDRAYKMESSFALRQLLFALSFSTEANPLIVPQQESTIENQAVVIDLAKFREMHTPEPVTRKQSARRMRSRAEMPFVAPSIGLSNQEVIDAMLPADVDSRVDFVYELTAYIREHLNLDRNTEKSERIELQKKVERGVVLLAKTVDYFKNFHPDSTMVSAEISHTMGLFLKHSEAFIYKAVYDLDHTSSALTLEDLMMEGKIGLLTAISRYDLGRRDASVMTYCKKRIRGAAIDAVRNTGAIIRQPRSSMSVSSRYHELTGLGMSAKEIAEEMQIPAENLRAKIAKFDSTFVQTVGDLTDERTLASKNLISEDHTAETAMDSIYSVQLVEYIDNLIDALDPREQTVLRMRFGLGPYNEPYTLLEIGKEFGITESRVSQIMADILGQLLEKVPSDLLTKTD